MYVLAPSAKAYEGGIKIIINGSTVSGSCNFTDAGNNFTCYFSHTHMLLYFMTQVKAASYHQVYGPANAQAYNSRISSKAQYSIKVSPWKIGPASIQDGIISEKDYVAKIEKVPETLKGKFFIYCFILQNWGRETYENEFKFNFEEADKEAFAMKIVEMQGKLISSDIMELDSRITEVVSTLNVEVERKTGRRPGSSKIQEFDFEINPVIAKVDLEILVNVNKDLFDDTKKFKLTYTE
ncbi:hypothetical protein INT46_003993 [Mucor plumbeus]|uniref:Uncharacterized protein n=1 Tax=Mucor plumbeus TaxID=97098 RepID=A0A8H7QDK6_9FUNG|nr:hypothetical protein INT46_003993 [Mucor plumbeus]